MNTIHTASAARIRAAIREATATYHLDASWIETMPRRSADPAEDRMNLLNHVDEMCNENNLVTHPTRPELIHREEA